MRRLHFVWAACLCGMVQALPHPHQGGKVEPRPQEGEKEEDVEDQTEDPEDLVGLVGGKRFFVFLTVHPHRVVLLTVHHHSVGVFAGNFFGGTYTNEKRVALGIYSKLLLFFATDS